MSLTGAVLGLVFFVVCLGIAESLGLFFTSMPTQTLDLLKIGFLLLGGASIFVGVLEK